MSWRSAFHGFAIRAGPSEKTPPDIHEGKNEQRLDEPQRALTNELAPTKKLSGEELPERHDITVLVHPDEQGIDQSGVYSQRDAQPDQAILQETATYFAVIRAGYEVGAHE